MPCGAGPLYAEGPEVQFIPTPPGASRSQEDPHRPCCQPGDNKGGGGHYQILEEVEPGRPVEGIKHDEYAHAIMPSIETATVLRVLRIA